MFFLYPVGLRLFLVGAVSWAAVGRLADRLVRRAVSLAVCAAEGTGEKRKEEVGQRSIGRVNGLPPRSREETGENASRS